MKRKPIIIVFGPTGVGKTDFTQELGHRINGEVINADMGQLYDAVSVGTARPVLGERDVKHWLFGIVKEPRDYDVMLYRHSCVAAIEEIYGDGKVPIIAGGTGFYVQSLLYCGGETGQKNDLNNSDTIKTYTWDDLQKIDPVRASEIHPHDTYRIQRAMVIWQSTGTKPSLLKPQFKPVGDVIGVFLERSPEDLKARIRARTQQMLEQGWLEECRRLKGTDWEPFIRKKGFIGYDCIFDALAMYDTMTPEIRQSLIEKIVIETMQYAKRQNTFGRMLRKKMESSGIPVHVYNLTLSPINLYLKHLASLVE